MEKPVRSSFQYLSISYECALAIGNSLNLPEMLHKVIHTMVHKTNAHSGIIWVRNGEQELQPVASAGINIKDVPAQGEIMDLQNVLNQIQKSRQFVLRHKNDKDFLQYCPVLTEKEESVLIVPVTNVAILHLIYAGRKIADEALANLLTGLSKKLSVAIEACMAHENIINEIQVREKAEKELTKKTEQLIFSEKELQGLYEKSEQARNSLQSILEDVAQKEEAIRESEEKYRSLFEFGMDGILIADIETKRFKYANPALCKMLGYSAEELKGMSLSDIHPKDNFEHVISEFEAQARAEKTLALDIPCLRKDGTIIYADINTTLALVDGKKCNIGFFRDNTEGKKAERALRESEERLKEILEHLQTGVVIIDAETHEIVDINSFAARMIGASKQEITGKICHKFICPAEIGKCPISDLGQSIDNSERELVTADGETIPVLKTVVPIMLNDRQYLIDSFIDISERKRAEEALNKKNEELNRFNRLAVGRELKMIELKKEINSLLEKSGKEPGYKIVGEPQAEVF